MKIIVILYVLGWIITGIYESYFGEFQHLSFWFNLGHSIFWPDIWFETNIGKMVGSILLALILIIGLKNRI